MERPDACEPGSDVRVEGRLAELEQFNRLAVERELKMIELKKEIDHLRALPGPSHYGPDQRPGLQDAGRSSTITAGD